MKIVLKLCLNFPYQNRGKIFTKFCNFCIKTLFYLNIKKRQNYAKLCNVIPNYSELRENYLKFKI